MRKLDRKKLEEERRRRKRIRDRNYRFRKMTDTQKRVRIAKDVLEQLDARRLIAANAGYLSFGVREIHKNNFETTKVEDARYRQFPYVTPALRLDPLKEGLLATPVHEVLDGVRCTVCGIGACFVAAIDRADGVTWGEMECLGNDDFMREYLENWFSTEQIGMIESAFEKNPAYTTRVSGSAYLGDRATEFGGRFEDPEVRLRAIMGNVIENNGTFKP